MAREPVTVLGWDIGGVNTKLACVREGQLTSVHSRAFEIQWHPASLSVLMRAMVGECGVTGELRHAVTMTAELSQAFRTKREGVGVVLDAVEAACAPWPVSVYAVDGRFLTPGEARTDPLAVAAANWAATARVVAAHYPTAILLDMGTTTTDIVPLCDGRVDARGWNDPDRLACGELVYTGVVRTAVEAMAIAVPYGLGMAGVSAEAFALAGDVYVWLGELDPRDYTARTPDRRPATRLFCGERLARAICADRGLIDEGGLTRLARAFAASQERRIAEAIAHVLEDRPAVRTAVVTGLGAFVAARAAAAAGLDVVSLAGTMGAAAARCAPAAAVALLLGDEASTSSRQWAAPVSHDHRLAPVTGAAATDVDHSSRSPDSGAGPGPVPVVDLVVKVGGGLLAHPACLGPVLQRVADAARVSRLLIVPGGGPFADAVREADTAVGLSDGAAHWMAILAMDQYAHLLADRMAGAVVVWTLDEVCAALGAGQTPALAPSRWMRDDDPLPHSWDVTSDSIAAWVAGRVGAARLVLVKPAGATGAALVDASFSRALPPGVSVVCVPGDDLEGLRDALACGRPHDDTDAHLG